MVQMTLEASNKPSPETRLVVKVLVMLEQMSPARLKMNGYGKERKPADSIEHVKKMNAYTIPSPTTRLVLILRSAYD